MADAHATETLTILDDEKARCAARAYRKTTEFKRHPVPTDHWELPSVDAFEETVRHEEHYARGVRTKKYPPINYRNAVLSFREETGLLTNALNGIETTELLTEVARSWRIASDPSLGAGHDAGPRPANAEPLWALRASTNNKTGSLTIVFPLCTIRREVPGKEAGKPKSPLIEVVIAPFQRYGGAHHPDDSDYGILLFRFSPRPAAGVSTTLVRRSNEPAPQGKAKKGKPLSSPRTTEWDEAVRRVIETSARDDADEALEPADERDLKAYLSSSAVRENLRGANTCLMNPPSPELREQYVAVIRQAVRAAARLDGIAISPAEDAVLDTLLAGADTPTLPELTGEAYGLGTADAATLTAAWEGHTGPRTYTPLALAALTGPLAVSRAFALVALYARVGGKKGLQTALQNTIRRIAENEGATRVAAWLQRHQNALRAATSGVGRIAPTEGMLLTAFAMANDYRPHDAVSYLEALRACGLDSAEVHLALELCQVLDGESAPANLEPAASPRVLAAPLGYPGIVKQLIRRVPASGAVHMLARIARNTSLSRVFLRTAQVIPGASTSTGEALAAKALAALEPAGASEIAGGRGSGNDHSGGGNDRDAAAALLAALAGSAPTWLHDAVAATLADTRQPASAGAGTANTDDALRPFEGFLAVWRARHPEESRAAFACDALAKGSVRFAAAELARETDPLAQACASALTSLEALERAATRVSARPSAADEQELRAALTQALAPIVNGTTADAEGIICAPPHAAGTHAAPADDLPATDANLTNAFPAPAQPSTTNHANAVDPGPELADAIGLRIVVLMTRCFLMQPGCLPPTADADPAPFDLLVAYTAHLAANPARVAEYGKELLGVLAAAGARSATFRAETALLAHYAQRMLVLSEQLSKVLQRSVVLARYHDVAQTLLPCILNAGSMTAFRTRCNSFRAFVNSIHLPKRKLAAPSAGSSPANTTNTSHAASTANARAAMFAAEAEAGYALYRMPLIDLVARFIEDPNLHIGRGDNPGHDLKRALNAQRQRRAACALTFSYVDPWQLVNLAEGIRWTYLENENRTAAALARELSACANLLREYLRGPLAAALDQSTKPHDAEAAQGLDAFGTALVDAIAGIREQGILTRGYQQEDAVAALSRELSTTAAKLTASAQPGAEALTAAAAALCDAVAETFPECTDLRSSASSLSTPALVEVFCRLVTSEHGPASSDDAENRELVLAELQRRAGMPKADAQVHGIAAWCDELAQDAEPNQQPRATLTAVARCSVALLRAGVRSDRHTLKLAADTLDDARVNNPYHVLALAQLVARFYRTFETNATWCNHMLQALFDDVVLTAPAELYDDIAYIARAAAEEAPTPSRRAIVLETAEVARALGTSAATATPYGAAVRQARDETAEHDPELAAFVTAAALYRHTGPLLDVIAARSGDDARAAIPAMLAGRALATAFQLRPWYLSRAVLKTVAAATDADDLFPASMRCFVVDLGANELGHLAADLVGLKLPEDHEALAVLQPLIQLVQGGSTSLATTLARTLHAADDLDEARGSWQPGEVSLVDLARRIARQTLPPVCLIDAFQQAALQHQPWATSYLAEGVLDDAAAAYVTLVTELTKAEPQATPDVTRATAMLAEAGVTALPPAFRVPAQTLLRAAAHPSPLRPRYTLNGRFEGFVSAEHDAAAQQRFALLALARTSERLAVAPTHGFAWLETGGADAGSPASANAATVNDAPAAQDQRVTEALVRLSSLLADLTSDAEATDSLQQLYAAVLANLLTLSLGDTTDALICGRGPNVLARDLHLMRASLADVPFTDLEASWGLEAPPQLITLADLVCPDHYRSDDTSARTVLNRLRAPLARALGGVARTLAHRALTTVDQALERAATPTCNEGGTTATSLDAATAAALASAGRDLAALAATFAEAGIEATEPERAAIEALRYLGAPSTPKPDAPTRLEAVLAAAEAIRTGDAYAGTKTAIAFLAAFPAIEPLKRLAERLDAIRATCASRIAVRIENEELDGEVCLLARNDSSTVPADLAVTAIELIPPDGEPIRVNLMGSAAAAARLALPCRGAGEHETPLAIALEVPERLERAAVTVYLQSNVGNRWCVRTAETLPAARIPRRLGSGHFAEEARLGDAQGRFIERADAELGDITRHLEGLDERKRGVKIVGAKGVGKTALARAVMARGLSVDGRLENVFASVTLDRDVNAALVLYDLLNALADTLAARGHQAAGAETSPAADEPTRTERAARAANTLRAAATELEQLLSTAAEPALATINPFKRYALTNALASLGDAGFAATLAIDEAQELARCPEDELNALRSIVAGTRGVCAWLFVGTGDLVDIDRRTRARDTAFSQLMRVATVSVTHFPPTTRARIITQMLADPAVLGAPDSGGVRFTSDAAAYLAEYTGGHARSALKIANAVLRAMSRAADTASPFANEAKRTVCAADIQWVLAGGGVREEDEIAYDSVFGDFREIEQRSGVEMVLRALLKLEGDGVRGGALADVVAAARGLDDERAADADGLAATVERGLRTLASRGFLDRQAAATPDGTEECYRFASVMYERFARFGYQSVVAARLAEMHERGHVSDETRAQEPALRDDGFRELYQDALQKAEQASNEVQAMRERVAALNTRAEMEAKARERAEARAREERERADRPQTVIVQPKLEGGDLNLAAGAGGTAGGQHVHGNQTNVSIGELTVNYTYQQLQQINATVAAALEGAGADELPADAVELATQLPWPDDHRFRQVAARSLGTAAEAEATGGAARDEALPITGESDPEAATLREATSAPASTFDDLRRAQADAAYAEQFAQAGELMLGPDAAGLTAWLAQDGNRRILAAVGITWNGPSDPANNPLFARALAEAAHDDDLLRTCRSVCVAAMVHELLKLSSFENYSPVAALLTQEVEHLWKSRLIDAVSSNAASGNLLVNWNETGGFTGRAGIPLCVWAARVEDSAEILNRSELGRFWRLGSFGPYGRGQNPWDDRFPERQPFNTPYRLAPAHAELTHDTLRTLAAGRADALWAAYDSLAYEERDDGSARLVNNLDVLAHAVVTAGGTADAAPDAEALRDAYEQLARYFAGLACVRSLRNHASHGTRDLRRSAFDERCAAILFAVTAADASDVEQLGIPPINFCTVWHPGRFQTAWSTIEPEAPGGTFAVDPANAGVLAETARLADRLGARVTSLER